MIRINLLPEELQRKVAIRFNLWYLSIIPLFVVIIAGIMYLKQINRIKEVKNEIVKVEQELAKYKDVEEQLQRVKEDISQLETQIQFIKEKREKQKFWIGVLDRLTAVLPSDVWLQSLSLNPDGSINMQGETFSYNSVANLIKTLNNSTYFQNAQISSASKSYGTGMQGMNQVSFSLTCSYVQEEKKL